MAQEQVWDFTGAAEAYEQAVRLAPARRGWARQLARVCRAGTEFRPFSGSLIAHRGRVAHRAENVAEGLDNLPPVVAGVEVDVRLSRDGVPVLMHDPMVDRTTDGCGDVAELSYAQLRSFAAQEGARVPALSDYLDACEHRDLRYILLDIKSPTVDTLRTVAAAVARSTVAGACVLLVRDAVQMRRFRDVASDLRLGGLGTREANVREQVESALTYGAEMLFIAHGDDRYLGNRQVVGAVQQAGLAVGGSIINSREALEAARLDGCDLILTDRAEQLRYFACGNR